MERSISSLWAGQRHMDLDWTPHLHCFAVPLPVSLLLTVIIT